VTGKKLFVLAEALILAGTVLGCTRNKDKCGCSGLFCDSPCTVEYIKTYKSTVYYSEGCKCEVKLKDQAINDSWRIPQVSFSMSPVVNGYTIFVEMDFDPNQDGDLKDTIRYDSLIVRRFYPENPPQHFSFIVSKGSDTLQLSSRSAWTLWKKDESISDDSGEDHGLRTTYAYKVEWNGDWVSGRLEVTSRDVLHQ
jgi:hypothetical protein